MQELIIKCDHCGKKLDLSNQSHDYESAEIDLGYNWLQCDLCGDCMKELYQYVLKYVGRRVAMNDKSTAVFNDNFGHKEYKRGLKCRKKSLKKTKKNLKKLINDYTGYDFSELHNIVMEIILDMWVIYRFRYGITTTDEESDRVERQLWEVLTLDSKIKAAEIDYTTPPMMEANLYKKLYSKIGEYITGWWD